MGIVNMRQINQHDPTQLDNLPLFWGEEVKDNQLIFMDM